MAGAAQNDSYNEVFEEAADERQEQTIHHIRANSSIMQLKKLLGKILINVYSKFTRELC